MDEDGPLRCFGAGGRGDCRGLGEAFETGCLEAAAAHAVAISLIFPLREEFWLEKLKKDNQLEVVFVLGEDHLDTFCRRLEGLGIQSKVLFRGIGVTAAQMCEIEAARRFPAENPNLFEAMIKGMRERD